MTIQPHDPNKLREGMPTPTYASDLPLGPYVSHAPYIGRAWKIDLEVSRKICNIKPEEDGTVAFWLIEAPWAHPHWHSYALTCIHLRDIPGHKPVIYLEGATHEFFILALTVEGDRARLAETGMVGREGAPKVLLPPNFAAQFIAETDEDAEKLIEDTVKDVCDGTLNPDTDYRSQWIKRFGDAMIKPEYR